MNKYRGGSIDKAAVTWSMVASIVAALPVLYSIYKGIERSRRRRSRARKVPALRERVLVLGATSGVGRVVATQYARRGAHVCIVGRNAGNLDDTFAECLSLSRTATLRDNALDARRKVLAIQGDFVDVQDMENIRATIAKEWQGLDTLIVAAGVSALQPLMSVARSVGTLREHSQPSVEGVQKVVSVSRAALAGNYEGPLVAAVTFIPLLESSSPSPSILLLSSLAAVVSAPTRSLYGATKAASLSLYEALAIEHSAIHFSYMIPATIEGNFRASAVDSPEVHEADPNKYGLKRDHVASRCIQAVDCGDRAVFMPYSMAIAPILYWMWPSFIEWRASVKYNFPPPA